MDKRLRLEWEDVYGRATTLAINLHNQFKGKILIVFGVPRGGVHAAQVVKQTYDQLGDGKMLFTEDVTQADVIIDDLVDSGTTQRRIEQYLVLNKGRAHADIKFYSLLNKDAEGLSGVWVEFPWEFTKLPWQAGEEMPVDAVTRLLQFIGEDPNREGLRDTPYRVVKSYAEIFGGYAQSPEQHLKVFEDDACDEMVLLKDVEFYSVCEHHMQPFFGKAHIAYVPDGKVVGVSKLARILDTYARRLQIQERLTEQVVNALMAHLQPKGAACIIEARHFCMVCRGVGKQNSTMVTSAMKGIFMEHGNHARIELFGLIRS